MNNTCESLKDFLSIQEDDINFLNLEVIDGSRLRDAKAFILPSFLKKDILGFDKDAALNAVTSFFDKILKIADSNENDADKISQMKELFSPIHEIKTLGLGYSKDGSQGNGPDYEALLQIGTLLNSIIVKWRSTGNLDDLMAPKSLPIFAPNFGPDALSDLLSALIYPQLLGYTEFVLKKFKVKYTLSEKPEKVSGDDRKVWDANKRKWTVSPNQIIVRGLPITLVPYELVTNYDKALDVKRYVVVFLLERLRKQDEAIDKAIKSVGRKKDYVKKIPNMKKYALEQTHNDLSVLTEFLQDGLNKGVGKELTGPNDIVYFEDLT